MFAIRHAGRLETKWVVPHSFSCDVFIVVYPQKWLVCPSSTAWSHLNLVFWVNCSGYFELQGRGSGNRSRFVFRLQLKSKSVCGSGSLAWISHGELEVRQPDRMQNQPQYSGNTRPSGSLHFLCPWDTPRQHWNTLVHTLHRESKAMQSWCFRRGDAPLWQSCEED